MSNAIAGVGVEFRRWNTTTGAWEQQAEINSISGPSPTRDTIDVTSLDSTDGYREFIGGFRDGGAVQLTMNFTRDTYDNAKADFESDSSVSYEIAFPDAENTTIEFVGFVTEIPLEIVPDDKITATVTIKISGKIVVASGSGPSAGKSAFLE